jgi:hypothetical protein
MWLLSLTVVGLLVAGVTAQVTRTVVSGPDLGFRIEGRNAKGEPTGRLVIKIDGIWTPVGETVRTTPATITSR